MCTKTIDCVQTRQAECTLRKRSTVSVWPALGVLALPISDLVRKEELTRTVMIHLNRYCTEAMTRVETVSLASHTTIRRGPKLAQPYGGFSPTICGQRWYTLGLSCSEHSGSCAIPDRLAVNDCLTLNPCSRL